MVIVSETRFMVVKPSFEFGFSHANILSILAWFGGFDFRFIDYRTASTLTIHWAGVLRAVARAARLVLLDRFEMLIWFVIMEPIFGIQL